MSRARDASSGTNSLGLPLRGRRRRSRPRTPPDDRSAWRRPVPAVQRLSRRTWSAPVSVAGTRLRTSRSPSIDPRPSGPSVRMTRSSTNVFDELLDEERVAVAATHDQLDEVVRPTSARWRSRRANSSVCVRRRSDRGQSIRTPMNDLVEPVGVRSARSGRTVRPRGAERRRCAATGSTTSRVSSWSAQCRSSRKSTAGFAMAGRRTSAPGGCPSVAVASSRLPATRRLAHAEPTTASDIGRPHHRSAKPASGLGDRPRRTTRCRGPEPRASTSRISPKARPGSPGGPDLPEPAGSGAVRASCPGREERELPTPASPTTSADCDRRPAAGSYSPWRSRARSGSPADRGSFDVPDAWTIDPERPRFGRRARDRSIRSVFPRTAGGARVQRRTLRGHGGQCRGR